MSSFDQKSQATLKGLPLPSGKGSSFQCSPALHRRDGETCLSAAALQRLRKTWNKTHPRQQIGSKTRKHTAQQAGKNQSNALWNELQEAMSSKVKCDTEYCAVKKMPGLPETEKKMMIDTFFKPEKPTKWDKKPTEWLDSDNISHVMRQYEQAHKNFTFIGPVPIDFDAKDPNSTWGKCIINELCHLNLAESKRKGKTKIGIVFNLDKHDEPGSHWVCGFIDLDKSAAYYFDSYGYQPPAEVVELLKRCKDQGCKTILYNDIRHQRKGSECGMYCLFVLICLLRGKEFPKICQSVVDDDTMNSFRDVIFAEEKVNKTALNKAVKTLCL